LFLEFFNLAIQSRFRLFQPPTALLQPSGRLPPSLAFVAFLAFMSRVEAYRGGSAATGS
jgi:hypothetical protein